MQRINEVMEQNVKVFEHITQGIKAVESKMEEISSTPSLKIPDLTPNLNKIQEEVSKNVRASSEILNSVEDLKQLNSSLPQELAPKMGQIAETLQAMQDKILSQNGQLQQQSLEEILKKFDLVESRFCVIRKYVKNMPEALQQLNNASNNNEKQPPNAGSEDQAELKLHVTNQCKVLGDSIAGALDKYLCNFDNSKLTQSLDSATHNINQLLLEIKDLCSDQAKASVVEDQLQALASTILEPLEEIRPIHDQLLTSIEAELRNLTKNHPTEASIETLNVNQSLILKELRKPKDNNQQQGVLDIVDQLKKVQGVQSNLMAKSSQLDNVCRAVNNIKPVLELLKGKHNNPLISNLRTKIEVIDDLIAGLKETQVQSQDLKTLISSLKIFIQHVMAQEAEATEAKEAKEAMEKAQRRKARKRSKSRPPRSEDEDEDEGQHKKIRRSKSRHRSEAEAEDEDDLSEHTRRKVRRPRKSIKYTDQDLEEDD